MFSEFLPVFIVLLKSLNRESHNLMNVTLLHSGCEKRRRFFILGITFDHDFVLNNTQNGRDDTL